MYNYGQMPDEYIFRIYTDERFRNAIAFAHVCCDNGGIFSHYCAMTPEGSYMVRKEEIDCAKTHLATCKDEVFKQHKNDLLFVSMGSDYEPRYEDDPCNHRIRTEFLNKDGHRYFIEVGSFGLDGMRVDFSIDRDIEIEYEAKRQILRNELAKLDKKDPKRDKLKKQMADSYICNPGYNFGNIARSSLGLKYTKQNILNLVNETFGCLFNNIVIDQRTISMSDREIICYSPTSTIKIEESVNPIMQLELF